MADIVTPADIAPNVQNPATNIQAAEVPTAPAPQTTDLTKSSDYKKYKDIYNIYNPTQQFINQQVNSVNDRYATNSADMKNLFGTLTTLRAQDAVKIQDQYAATIAAQQAMLAGRTAEARQIQKSMQESAAQAGSELGGPANAGTGATASANLAIERGVGQSNALATVWQNMMASQNMNNQASIQKQIAGYAGQEQMQTQQLGQKRDAQLLDLSGQQTQLNTNIAQSKSEFNAAEKARKEQAKNDALNRANALAIQKLQNQNKPYSNDLAGWNKQVTDMGGNPDTYSTAVDGAYVKAQKAAGKDAQGNYKTPTKSAVLRQLKALKNPDGTPMYNADEIALMSVYLDRTE